MLSRHRSGAETGALLLDYDLFELIGGVAAQTETLKAAGFTRVDCLWLEGPRAILAAVAG
jgi:hypothetical protein